MIESNVRVCRCRIEWPQERRWFFQFFVSILICLNNGACFCFSIFSPFMKKGAFKYNQSQVNVVSTMGVILSYFSLPTGYLYDFKGPMPTLLVGTILNMIGWLGMFLMFFDMERPLLGTNIGTMCLFYGISQFSASFYESGSVLTNLDAFSCYQGRVILIQKTFMGLGSSIIAQIYIAFFETRVEGIGPFFFFLVIYSLTVGVLGTLFVRLPTEKTYCLGLNIPDEDVVRSGGGESPLFRLPLNVGTCVLLLSIAYILMATLLENYHLMSDSDRLIIGIFTIVLVMSFSSMIFITPSYSWNIGGYRPQPSSSLTQEELSVITRDVMVEGPTTPDNARLKASTSLLSIKNCPKYSLNDKDAPREKNEMEPLEPREFAPTKDTKEVDDWKRPASKGWSSQSGDNFAVESEAGREEVKLNSKSLWYNMRRRELWLMWYVCFASWSSATVVSTNSSQIYEAMNFDGYSSTVNVVFVSIYGVASAVGRVIVGALHPFLLRKKISVSVLFCIAPVLNAIGLPLFLGMPQNALVVPFFIVGLATGVSWGSTILIVKGLFAPDNCGKHYSALYTAGIVSPLIFNVALFGPLYDYYSRQQGRWDTRKCEGRVCIWVPLVACAVVNAIALPLSIYFLFRVTKRGGLL
ncbi:hypothetical protein DQ04_00761080 [Trypanosoma grayi]|uniref:hypothetical protein n=1 Tax=Trypanosoma grayi TaxID=71804 RepID=UPI0004F48352|nr:hypothetical protein DQ04_00761080 [Trypanosoma grayi]KEG13828.1 hypothetical protein DQ04_00761080 [Trypanosoma grayi]